MSVNESQTDGFRPIFWLTSNPDFSFSPEGFEGVVPVVDVAVLPAAVGRHEVGHEGDRDAHVAHPVAGAGGVEQVAEDLLASSNFLYSQ